MPLIRPRSHHRRINELVRVSGVVDGSEVPCYSSLLDLGPLGQVFSPARRLVGLDHADVLAEWRWREALGVVLVRQCVVVVNVVVTTACYCVHVPRSRLQPTLPCLTYLDIIIIINAA